MNTESLTQAVALGQQLRHALVATADGKGAPHVAVAERMTAAARGRIRLSAWFCPGTMRNLEENRRVAVVVWDRETDTGYQLAGEVEEATDLSVLDGYSPAAEPKPIPQVLKQLLIRVDGVSVFTRAPHTDEPMSCATARS